MTAAEVDSVAVQQFAPSKINLALHVTGQRPDGYHLLDSLVVFADVGDRLKVEPAEEMSLKVTGRFSGGVPAGARNLVWQAAEAAGHCCSIHLEKNLPHGAGLGGGSSDAAAVLRALGAPEQAEKLGADVPVCLSNAPQHMQGIGEILSIAGNMPVWHMVLVNPGIGVSTPDVFRALTEKENAPMTPLPSGKGRSEILHWLCAQRNDLEPVARRLVPEIDDVLHALADADLARMSGSGSTCFGLYDSHQQALAVASRIASAHPDWWVIDARSFGHKYSPSV